VFSSSFVMMILLSEIVAFAQLDNALAVEAVPGGRHWSPSLPIATARPATLPSGTPVASTHLVMLPHPIA
jgi:hypothetical protein